MLLDVSQCVLQDRKDPGPRALLTLTVGWKAPKTLLLRLQGQPLEPAFQHEDRRKPIHIASTYKTNAYHFIWHVLIVTD